MKIILPSCLFKSKIAQAVMSIVFWGIISISVKILVPYAKKRRTLRTGQRTDVIQLMCV